MSCPTHWQPLYKPRTFRESWYCLLSLILYSFLLFTTLPSECVPAALYPEPCLLYSVKHQPAHKQAWHPPHCKAYSVKWCAQSTDNAILLLYFPWLVSLQLTSFRSTVPHIWSPVLSFFLISKLGWGKIFKTRLFPYPSHLNQWILRLFPCGADHGCGPGVNFDLLLLTLTHHCCFDLEIIDLWFLTLFKVFQTHPLILLLCSQDSCSQVFQWYSTPLNSNETPLSSLEVFH